MLLRAQTFVLTLRFLPTNLKRLNGSVNAFNEQLRCDNESTIKCA